MLSEEGRKPRQARSPENQVKTVKEEDVTPISSAAAGSNKTKTEK